MRLHEPHELLVEKVKQFAQTAMEAKQVARRLKDLLPQRFMETCRRHYQSSRSMARAGRMALTDKEYVAHLEEFADVAHPSR